MSVTATVHQCRHRYCRQYCRQSLSITLAIVWRIRSTWTRASTAINEPIRLKKEKAPPFSLFCLSSAAVHKVSRISVFMRLIFSYARTFIISLSAVVRSRLPFLCFRFFKSSRRVLFEIKLHTSFKAKVYYSVGLILSQTNRAHTLTSKVGFSAVLANFLSN